MKCDRCGSENISVQIVNKVKLVKKHHSIWWWLLIGYWWIPLKWLFFTIPALIIKLIKGKKQKVINKETKMAICQQCGYSWKI